MRFEIRAAHLPPLIPFCAAVVLGIVGVSPRPVLAATCNVVEHGPPSPAEQAYLASDYAKAEMLYRDALKASPDNAELIEGLVHALLHEEKLQEASDSVEQALARAPGKAALITLRGEVEYREGEPWKAAASADESIKLDPCNPRTHLLFSKLAGISSIYAGAKSEILTAHALDPEDPDIREAWIMMLPRKKRVAELEAFLSQPNGENHDELLTQREYLDHLKKLLAEPQKPCRLVSNTTSAQIPFQGIRPNPRDFRGFGLDVKLNGHPARLQIDTGAGGLLVSRSVAKHAGLKPFSQQSEEGIGDEGFKSGYMAYADSIQIGNLTFQNCAVQVEDLQKNLGAVDGLIGMDVFSHFLVTLDYPTLKLGLDPLPQRPGDKTSENALATSGSSPETEAASTADEEPPTKHESYNRYIPPGMNDYTELFRVGHLLVLPVRLNNTEPRLFILDTGAWTTLISSEAAREVTKISRDYNHQIGGISGSVKDVYSAEKVAFQFAGLAQEGEGVFAIDTSKISDGTGMEISGFLGAATLGQLTTHIDYRDGLVKFDYNPKGGRR